MPLRYYLLALCVAGVHALATAADFDADRAAGHRTLAVVFGRRAAAALACAAFLAAWWLGDYQSFAVRTYLATCAVATAGRRCCHGILLLPGRVSSSFWDFWSRPLVTWRDFEPMHRT